MECSRATGGRGAGEQPGRQTPIPGAGLGYTAIILPPWLETPVSSQKKGAGVFPLVQQVGGRCASRTSHIWLEKEKPWPDVPVTQGAIIWSQPWVTALYVASYLWTWVRVKLGH